MVPQLDDALRATILQQLAQARRQDPQHRLFGASRHRYALNPPVSPEALSQVEQRYGFVFPPDFTWFMTRLGNGGAGPHYGVDPIDPADDTQWDWRYGDASAPAVDLPMTRQEWQARLKQPWGTPEDPDRPDNLSFAGMIYIGTQGCTYHTMLVANGPHLGRVAYIDEDCTGPPHLPRYGSGSFIEWYLTWLEEVAAGYAASVGFDMPGSPDQILAGWESYDETERLVALESVRKAIRPAHQRPPLGPGASAEVAAKLTQIYHTEPSLACQHAALESMQHLGVVGWTDEVRRRSVDPQWVELCATVLREVRRSGQVDPWYDTLLAALPAAARLDDEPRARVLGLLVELASECSRFRLTDLRGCATQDTVDGLVEQLSRRAPLVPRRWLRRMLMSPRR